MVNKTDIAAAAAAAEPEEKLQTVQTLWSKETADAAAEYRCQSEREGVGQEVKRRKNVTNLLRREGNTAAINSFLSRDFLAANPRFPRPLPPSLPER